MIIDSHQHFWQVGRFAYPWMSSDLGVLYRDYLPDDLAPILRRNGVNQTVLVQASNSVAESRWLLDLANENSFVAGVVGWVDLQKDNVEERLEFFSQYPIIKGWRHVVQGEPDDFLLRPAFQNLLPVCLFAVYWNSDC